MTDTQKACATNRKIHSCEDCIRKEECACGCKNYKSEKGTLKLGMAVLYSMAHDYIECWQKGYINHVKAYEVIFKGTYCTILSAGNYDGLPILEGLTKQCELNYGSLMANNRKMKKEVNEKIEKLIEKRKRETNKVKKFDLTNKINELKGELNY